MKMAKLIKMAYI